MPLNSSQLESSLESLFAAPPADAGGCGQGWADAVADYAAGLTPPSATVSAAAATLGGALGAAFASPSGIGAMESAFAAFGASVALGQSPAFVGVPPAGAVGFAAQFGGPKPETHGAAASAVASLIHAWMQTGTATPSGGGAPINWS